ncbi:MAG: TaqI-like C-terminal specificity domain-containing protein, partial [Nitrosopumilus sp.]
KTWFEFWDSKPICFESPKIVFPDISNQNNFYLDIKGTGYLNTCYGIFLKDDSKCHYILGILNSRLIEFFIKRISPFVRGGFYRYKTKYVEQLPIQTIDFSDPTNKSRHDKMVRLVESILELNKQLAQAKTPHDREVLQRQIDATDKQIDRLVYELYELSEEEIGIVEGKE